MTGYLTDRYVTDDLDRVLRFVADCPFATLVPERGARAAMVSLPLLLDEHAGGRTALYGHVDRRNPALAELDGARTTALFQGPNGYVSPTDYVTRQFPTWNYAVAQIEGTVRLVADGPDRTLGYMRRMVADLERRNGSGYRLDESDPLLHERLRCITFLRLEVAAARGTFKFAQEKTLGDRTRARDRLIRKLHDGQRRTVSVLAGLDPGDE